MLAADAAEREAAKAAERAARKAARTEPSPERPSPHQQTLEKIEEQKRRLEEQERALAEKDERIEYLEHDRDLRDALTSDDERTVIQKGNNDAELIKTLKARANEWQFKHAEATRTIRSLRAKLSQRDKQIETLKAEIATLKGESNDDG